MVARGPSKGKFGGLVLDLMSNSGVNQPQVAETLGVSTQYVNKLTTGRQKPSPEWVDLIASAVAATDEQRVELHRAAAEDHGFRLDLPKE